MRKVTTWCHFENLPPLEPSKPYGWFNIWRKLTCWVIAIDLSSGPLQNTLFDIWTDLASWVMFEMSLPSPTTKQDVERTKLELRVMFGIYAHWTIHSNTFNIWIKLTCWCILLDLPALSPTKPYVWCMNQHGIFTYVKMFLAFPCIKTIRWTHGKKGILSHFWNLQSLDPTKQYVKKKRWKLTRRVFFYGESWHVELFLKFSPPRPYKANGWTRAENWHVGLFCNL